MRVWSLQVDFGCACKGDVTLRIDARAFYCVLQASRAQLWAMPALQVGWLAFFLVDAVHKFWYNYWLLVPCFATGEGVSPKASRALLSSSSFLQRVMGSHHLRQRRLSASITRFIERVAGSAESGSTVGSGQG